MTNFRVVGNFNKVNPADREYVSDPSLMRISRGRRQSRRIRNNMDESEAGGCTRICLLCNEKGHKEKYCSKYPGQGSQGRGQGSRVRGGRR